MCNYENWFCCGICPNRANDSSPRRQNESAIMLEEAFTRNKLIIISLFAMSGYNLPESHVRVGGPVVPLDEVELKHRHDREASHHTPNPQELHAQVVAGTAVPLDEIALKEMQEHGTMPPNPHGRFSPL